MNTIAKNLSNLPEATEQKRCSRLYTDFFHLKEIPFSITPDPEFLFLSETHQSVIEKIQYGIQSRMGFMLLTGEVGTGKTTICRVLLDDLQDSTRTVYIINPSLNGQELLASILDDLGVSWPVGATKKELIDHLNQFLLTSETTKPILIIIDDAQTMPLATLEDMRLLSNLETDKNKLLQILLVGQPELLVQLKHPQMRQLKQRVAVNCVLDYLNRDEVSGYIERRLFIAGNQGQIRFAPKTVKQIHRQSGGVPRLINKICDLALTAAYTTNNHIVNSQHLKAAYSELIELKQPNNARHHWWLPLFSATAGFILAMVAGFSVYPYFHQWSSHKSTKPGQEAVITASTIPNPSVLTEAPVAEAPSQPQVSELTAPIGPFILQLGSYNTIATTLRAIDIYAQKGIEAHWNALDLGPKGVWYRVFAGRYLTMETARQYQQDKNLRQAKILYAPWAVALGPSGAADQTTGLQARLPVNLLDVYSAANSDGQRYHYSGAFVSRQRAEAMADYIYQQTGIVTRAVDLQHPLVPLSSITMPAPGDAS